MNREQKERLHYIAPRCTVIPMEKNYLLHAMSGQHEHVEQGGTLGNAKRRIEEWEDEEEEISYPLSREGSSYSVWEE